MKLSLLGENNESQSISELRTESWSRDFDDDLIVVNIGRDYDEDMDTDDYAEQRRRRKKPMSEDLGSEFQGGRLDENVNPDTLVQERGLRAYDKMLDIDASVRNAYFAKKLVRISTPWQIHSFDNEDPEAEAIRDFVDWNLSKFLIRSFDSFLLKMWDATRLGYKVAEMMWAPIEDGEYAGKVGISDFIVRNSRNYSFQVDKHGLLKPRGLIEGLSHYGHPNTHDGKPLPVKKFVIFSWNALDDDGNSYYGRSDFRTAFRYYDSNRIIQKILNRSIETFAKPPMVVKYPMASFSVDQQKKIVKDASKAYDKQATGLPDSLEIEMLETKRRQEDTFFEAMEYNDKQISRAMGVGPLLSAAAGRGSFAMSRKQFEIFALMQDHLGRATAEVVDHQIIRRMVDMNFNSNKYPRFFMPSVLKSDQEVMTNIVGSLVKVGVVDAGESWVREFLGLPQQALDEGTDNARQKIRKNANPEDVDID